MPRTARYPLAALSLGESPGGSLNRRIYGALRAAILEGRLAPGERIPASRLLAAELGCARGTVLAAVEQLHAEGYLRSAGGSGTFVAEELPDELLALRAGARRRSAAAARPPRLSRAGRALAAGSPAGGRRDLPFSIGRPALDAFPTELWSRLLAESWRGAGTGALLQGEPAGLPALRAAIAGYLRAARGLDCRAEDVIVTGGTQHALALVARLLLEPGDRVWVEDPGYPALRATLAASGADVVPVPVDAEGLALAGAHRAGPPPRLVAVTPSHQFPLGTVMSLKRRLELLQLAEAADAWILEDDYDSEFRYRGKPLEPLRLLDEGGRVIYLGTFSKVLFPGLRLGYLVAPPGLSEAFAAALPLLEPAAAMPAQAALARFIAEGHFAVHLRRMRQLYAARQAALVEAAGAHLRGRLEVVAEEAGMHLVARPSGPGFDDVAVAAAAARAGLVLAPLSRYFAGPGAPGFLLGYAGWDAAAIAEATRRLASVLAAA